MTLDAVPAGQSADHEHKEDARSCTWMSGARRRWLWVLPT